METENDGCAAKAIVDVSAIAHNVRQFKNVVSDALLMAVLKADAYGHGSPQGLARIAEAAMRAGADMLGVAHVSEGISLRESLGAGNKDIPILAWLHTKNTNFVQAIRHNVTLGVSSFWELEAVAEAVRSLGVRAEVHLKVDTGLGRNGSTMRQWPVFVTQAKKFQDGGFLNITGIFSHFAVADEPDNPETARQLELFHQAVAMARETGITRVVRHMANTPAALSRPETHLDMVRIGLGIYGLSPFVGMGATSFRLKPAMTLLTRVAQVKDVPTGQGVSYGLKYATDRPTRLGLVPIGYGDGIPRTAYEAPVSIRGRKYFSAGRIAMDQFVVDLGPSSEVQAGDEVMLFGDPQELYGDNRGISVEEWAGAARTINYEIVTRIGPRIPRHYIGDARSAEDPGPLWKAKFTTHSSVQTQELAEKIAGELRVGDLVVLNGGLGAGKTTFTQGLGRGLGIDDPIASPTFVLVHQHENSQGGGSPGLVHVDAYRLGSAAEIDDLDLEYTTGSSVTVVEWGEGKTEHLSSSRLVIDIVYDPEAVGNFSLDSREINISGYGSRWKNPLKLS